jgi:hypothetical protein
MLRENFWTCVALAVILVGLCGGCGSADAPASRTAATPPATRNAAPAADAPAADSAEIEKALAELSPEDRAIAEKQKVCLVAGGSLGGMGKPVKVSVKGHQVFICCKGCESELLENPDKYLAKLPLADDKSATESKTKTEPESKDENKE